MDVIMLETAVILLLFVANGVFAMTEMAMVSSRKSRLRLLADGGHGGARVALRLADEPNRFLPSCISSMSFIIRPKSSSVSPGKPTMKSLDRLMCGRTARSLRIVLLYSIAV